MDRIEARLNFLEQLVSMQERLDDNFLRTFITQLLVSVPQFDEQAFLETLYLDQASLPTPSEATDAAQKSLREIALSFWKRKVVLAQEAISAAEGIQERLENLR